jgi:pyruvate formate lyase activating enzyme
VQKGMVRTMTVESSKARESGVGELPRIRGFLPSTLIDWSGRVAAEVFLGRCNFRCPFCHAAHLVLRPAQLEEIAADVVLGHIRGHVGWLDGVVISGGEPTLDPHLPDLVEACREAGVGVKLDTNGSRPDALRALIEGGRLDAVSMDIKAPLDARYARAAGVQVDLGAIRESIALLMAADMAVTPAAAAAWPTDLHRPPAGACAVEFRTTVCPVYHSTADIVDIARTIAGAREYCLQPFRPVNCIDPAMLEVRPYSDEEMQALAAAAGEFVRRAWVRGRDL